MDATLTWPKALLAVIACVLLYAWLFGFPSADGPKPDLTPERPSAVQPETAPADAGPTGDSAAPADSAVSTPSADPA
jgi:hypothetical protein